MSMLPPLPAGGVPVVQVLSEMSVGVVPGGGVLLSIHLECGLLGFIVNADLADRLAKELVLQAAVARTGLTLPPSANGKMHGSGGPGSS